MTSNQEEIQAQLCDGLTVDSFVVKPKFALIVYANDQGTRTTMTRHGIANNQLKEGSLINPQSVMKLINTTCSNQPPAPHNAILDSCILAQDHLSVTWHRSRQKKSFYLYEELITVELPPLLFQFTLGGGLKVAALRYNRRPTSTDTLYHAPFGNIYGDGRVCLGSMMTPRVINNETIKAIETEFFSTKFTHTNHDKILRTKTANTDSGFRNFSIKKSTLGEPIRISELNPMLKTVASWF